MEQSCCDIKLYKEKFNKITILERYPWVGCNFASSDCRPLVIGDSHYATNGKDFSQEEYDNFKNNKASTCNIINTVIKNYCNGESTWPMYRNMLLTFNISVENVLDFWSKVAFYNFIQEPMKSSDEEPSQEDIANGWRCLAGVIEILHPTSILIFGVRNDKCSNKINENNSVRLEDFKDDTNNKINRCRPRIGKIILGNEEIPLTLIHHPSQGYNCDLWRNYLLKRDPRMMDYLLS